MTTSDEPQVLRPKGASPPATRKGQRSAEAFRQAAAVVFERKGFLNSTVADIALEAGRSPSSFYYHYDSKEDILAALFREFSAAVSEQANARTESSIEPSERIDELVRGFFRTYVEWLPVLTAVFQLSMVDEDFYENWKAIRRSSVRLIRRWVKDAQRDGHGLDLDPDLTSSALAAMLDGFCYIWLARSGDLTDVEFDPERAQKTLAAICYRGIYADPLPPSAG